MKTIVFAASKGGVGKTTLCAALSSYASAASKKKRIAIIDLDPQGSLTGWWNQRESKKPRTHRGKRWKPFADAQTSS